MSEEKKYIGESPIQGKPKKKILFKIPPIEWEKLSKDLQTIILSGGGSAIPLSDDWGNSEILGISQKKLTEEHDRVNGEIDRLGATINTETETRRLGDDTLRERIEGAENAINEEKERAEGVEEAHGERLTSLESTVGSGGDIDTRISNAVAAETQRAQGAESTLDGKIATEKIRAEGVESGQAERITSLETAVGTGGSVDSRIADAKSEIKGNATSACDTLGKAETLISAEATARQNAVSTERARAIAVEATKADKSDTYTKAEVNSLITTPDQQYVTVATYAGLPVTGAADTIYRVANWDGTQVVSNVYSEYAWDGSAYVFLDKKEVGIDDEPTAGSNNLVKSGGVAAVNGYYSEDPEFVRVVTDAEGKILYGVHTNGNFYFGAGCPQQVKDYIQPMIDAIVGVGDTTEGIDTLNEMIAFFDQISNDTTLVELLDEKVDKEEGKGLIPNQYVQEVENSEFVKVVTDNDGKILYAVRENGEFYFGAGVPQQVIDYVVEHTDATREELIALIDEKADREELDDKVDKVDGKSLIDAEVADRVQYTENPEWVDVKTDAEGRILEGFNNNGEKIFGTLPPQVKEYVDDAIAGIPIDPELNETFKHIEDTEGRLQIGLDAEEKIINYRKEDGTLVENAGIETDKLTLTDEGMSDFQKALRGFVDFSSNEVVELPEPKHFAVLNLHLVGGLPRREGEVINGYAEYYDFAGNSFKKSCAVEIQGQTSKYYAINGGKGNYTLDITDGSEIKFGSWVPQDSFHLKGCAKDVTRGLLSTSYKLAYKLVERLDAKPNRALFEDDSNTTTRVASGDRFTDWGDSARCLPDGFPIEVYLDGNYWGLYALQLKKHRKNYSMKKSDYTTVLVEAANYMSSNYRDGFWTGDIWWNNIEIRNPKDLVLKNGGTYDNDVKGELMGKKNVVLNSSYWAYTGNGTDVEPAEGLWDAETEYAIDDTAWMADDTGEWWYEFKAIAVNTNEPCLSITTNEYYDSSIKVHKNTVITKDIINTYPKRYIEVKNLIADGKIEDYEVDGVIMPGAKTKFRENFDYNACMVVFLQNGLMRNGDSIGKNTLWGIYKNGKIAPMLWDLDSAYGEGFNGTSAVAPSVSVWTAYTSANWPLKSFWTLFEDDIKDTYATLRREGVISMDTWRDVIYNQWVNRIGAEAYERDIEKWPDTPSYRENNLNSEYWATTDDDYTELAEWDENTEYHVGDKVYYTFRSSGTVYHQAFRAVKAGSGKVPLTKIYAYPPIGGYFNSPKRMEKWMIAQLELCDAYMGYHE